MPGKDGKCPFGTGPTGSLGGRGGRRGGVGPAPYCVCPNCGERVSHTAGTPCTSLKCPKCGAPMVRGT